jgi:hypothetical protein
MDTRSFEAILRAERGFHLDKDLEASKENMMASWAGFRAENPDASSLIIATTNKTVDDLNQRARVHLLETGEIRETRRLESRQKSIGIGAGDRIIFTSYFKNKGLYRSEIVTVTGIQDDQVRVRKDNGL